MSTMQRIAIIGVGLIGGSLGLVWKKQRRDLHVTGFDNAHVLKSAQLRGAIDEQAATLEDAVADADLVVLATPLRSIVTSLESIGPHLKDGAIVTDVGSVKGPVLAHAAAVLPEHVVFVGGHPMAGSERYGIEHADAFLFENATYVLCLPCDAAGFTERHPRFIELLQATGARLLVLDPERHDAIAATISHLPQLLAITLMNYAAERNNDDDSFLKLAAGGFRDMTRIAASPFSVWRDILLANTGPILDVLAGFVSELQRLRNRIGAEELDDIESVFQSAWSSRESIPRDTKGFLHPLADVYVYAEDRPGELLTITRILHEESLNIKDIELLKIREGTGGAFRIGFSDSDSAENAVASLTNTGFTAYRL